MSRYTWLAVLGAVAAAPGDAAAQFRGGPLTGRAQLGGFTLPLPNYYGSRAILASPVGRIAIGASIYGPSGYYWGGSPGGYSAGYSYLYPAAGTGYMSGSVGNPALDAARENFAAAQKAATVATLTAKGAVHDQWAYEKFGAPGVAAVKAGADAPAAVAKALAETDERALATGEPLNHLVVAAAAAEKKAGKVESAFLPPNLLADLRFAGPKADAVNLLRRAGRLDFPAGFDQPALADAREKLDREFAAAASPVLLGKAADPSRAARLEAAVADARKALTPQIAGMSFEDATAARRLLNQLDATARTLRGPGTAGLIDPAWQVEGANAAGLVRYMSRHNLLFAPAAPGTEDRYVAAHRALGVYLFNLTEGQKK